MAAQLSAQTGPEAEGGGAARGRLLDAVIEHFVVDGLADQSLRRIAEATGTSHRMLLYHFGSREGLMLAVVRAVETRTRANAGRAGRDGAGQTDELVRRMWAYVADPGLGDFERLFFALYGRALQGDPASRPLLQGRPRDLARGQCRAGVRRPGCPPTSPAPTAGSAWPSSAGCCSTSWRPATGAG